MILYIIIFVAGFVTGIIVGKNNSGKVKTAVADVKTVETVVKKIS